MSETTTRAIDVEVLVETENLADVTAVILMTITTAVAIIGLRVATIETAIVIVDLRLAVVIINRTATESKQFILTLLVAQTRLIHTTLVAVEKSMNDVLEKNENSQKKCILTLRRSKL
jgi:choline-glycine betaine transporter